MWVWETLEEAPPYSPGYAPRPYFETEDEDQDYRQRRVALHAFRFPDEPPLDPDDVEPPLTPEPDVLDALHHVPMEPLVDRLERCDATALTLPVEAVGPFWREKAEAVEALDRFDYLWVRDPDTCPSPEEFADVLWARSLAAKRAAQLAGEATDAPRTEDTGWPSWLRLAEPSRANDKWGPLVPFLDHAMQETADVSADGTLRKLAEVCREHPEAQAYCRAKGIVVDFQVDMHASTLSRLRKRAFEYRRARRGDPSDH